MHPQALRPAPPGHKCQGGAGRHNRSFQTTLNNRKGNPRLMKLLLKTTAPVLGFFLFAAFLPGHRAEALKAKPAASKPPAAEPQAKPPESLTYGRFGQVAIYRSTPHPK